MAKEELGYGRLVSQLNSSTVRSLHPQDHAAAQHVVAELGVDEIIAATKELDALKDDIDNAIVEIQQVKNIRDTGLLPKI